MEKFTCRAVIKWVLFLEDWQKLVEQQTTSPLTIADFCKQHDLGQSNFYKRKSELKKSAGSPQNTVFLKVRKPVSNANQSTSIKIEYQQIRISLPIEISP